MRSLLSKDADLFYATDELGHSVLFAAVMGKQLEVCEFLIENGADVNEQSEEFGFTVLHKACLLGCMDIVKLLIDNGADVTLKDPKENDALYNAITGTGDLNMCKYLVRKGASCEGALHLACFTGKFDVVEWFLDEIAQGTGRPSIGSEGVNTKGFRGNTALHLACLQGHFEICRLLIQRGADVLAANEVGSTPLHEAVLSPHAARIAALLIAHGADIHARDREDRAPLHKASSMGHIEHCKVLLDIGADINILDQSKCQIEHRSNKSPLKGAVGTGDSALHWAILSGNIKMCAFLIDRGIDMRIKSALGKPIVHFACHHKKYKIGSLLIERGADVDALDYKQMQIPTGSPETSAAARKRHSSGDEEVPMLSITYSETALQTAARAGHTEACEMLLEHGADVNVADEVFGNTPLHIVCQEGFRDICELLLRHRANINVTNRYFDSESGLNREDTPLHVAAAEGHLDVCQLLVDQNADVSICNAFGQDAVAAASPEIKDALELYIGEHIIESNSIYDTNGENKHTVSRDYVQTSPTTLPYSGPERVWKHRKVRFTVKKTIFKRTIWETEILSLQSAPGQGAWITSVPCNNHVSAVTVSLRGIVPSELQIKRGGEIDLRLVFKEELSKYPFLKLSFGTDDKRRKVWKAALLKHLENGK